MAVFTALQRAELETFIGSYSLGQLNSFRGIAEGTENSNFIVELRDGQYVLTLVERGSIKQLEFVTKLLTRLHSAGLSVPYAITNNFGETYRELAGRPALLQPLLKGEHVSEAEDYHCREVGNWLAQMHLVTLKNTLEHNSDRGIDWMLETGAGLIGELPGSASALLQTSLVEIVDCREQLLALPKANLHADLFRDNVLFQDDRLTGVVDFFNACSGPMLYDLAIAVNDWCVKTDGALNNRRTKALLAAYSRQRMFSPLEIDLWPLMLRVASLRFWLSRLIAARSAAGKEASAKDPEEFRLRLEANQRVEIPLTGF